MIEFKFDPGLSYTYLKYRRYSNLKGQKERSIDQQDDEIERVRKLLGRPWRAVKAYEDRGITGKKNEGRPGFSQMLSDIRAKRIRVDLILVDTMARFGRNTLIPEIRRELREEHGVIVLAANKDFMPPRRGIGEIEEAVENYTTIEHNTTKAHDVARGRRDKVKQKKWPGGRPPFGYQLSQEGDKNASRRSFSSTLVPVDSLIGIVDDGIFGRAADQGMSGLAITRELNNDPLIQDKYKPFHESTVTSILQNPIYIGRLEFGKKKRDIVDDKHVTERQPREDWIIIDDYCPPMTSVERFNKANECRKRRVALWAKDRFEHGKPLENKLLKPMVAAIQVKHMLVSLVRCPDCGSRMVVRGSGYRSRAGDAYRYYICPRAVVRGCHNKVHVDVDALDAAVIKLLRTKLFPLNPATAIPEWFDAFVQLAQDAFGGLQPAALNARGAIAAEIDTLESSLNGWRQSLGNPQLGAVLRADLEKQFEEATAKIGELQCELGDLDMRQEMLGQSLDASKVQQRLRHLDAVLGSANQTLLNVELARHIDRIDCGSDGRIIIRGTHVGLFDGLYDLVGGMAISQSVPVPIKPLTGRAVRVRKLTERDLHGCKLPSGTTCSKSDARFALKPNRYADLDDKFMWSEDVRIQRRLRKFEQLVPRLQAYLSAKPRATMSELIQELNTSKWLVKKALAVVRTQSASAACPLLV